MNSRPKQITQKEAADMLFMARLFYFAMHCICWMTLALYKNPFRQNLENQEFFDPILFIMCVLVSNYLFVKTKQNPGFLKVQSQRNNDLEENQQLEMTETQVQNIQLVEETTDIQIDIKELAPKEFCKECQIYRYHRSKHCHKCGRCVSKFDHHCFWMGSCVGELNHRSFWFFLLFQTYVHTKTLLYFCDGMDNYPYSFQKEEQVVYSQEYGAFLILSIIMLALNLFTWQLGMLIYHTYLILSGQTTWEHVKRDRIYYLKIYPRSFHPFDFGIYKNIKIVFCHNNQIMYIYFYAILFLQKLGIACIA